MSKNTILNKKTTLNCKGKLLNIQPPIVMGILNITPDSFFDGGKYKTEKEIIKKVEQMIEDGASIIDIGAISTKPNAENIAQEEELKRLIPILKTIIKEFPSIIISLDTYRSQVAEIAINEGVAMINDISGGNLDENMFKTIARLNVPYVLMHMQGTPQTMQNNPTYNNVVKDVIFILSKKIDQLRQMGVNDIIVDPGFGFGKTLEQNYQLLKNLKYFDFFELPILIGISRKSMINKVLNIKPDEALNGTSILNTMALLNGANILRVHDVKEAVEAVKLVSKFNETIC